MEWNMNGNPMRGAAMRWDGMGSLGWECRSRSSNVNARCGWQCPGMVTVTVTSVHTR